MAGEHLLVQPFALLQVAKDQRVGPAQPGLDDGAVGGIEGQDLEDVANQLEIP
jgi:hypothetical protein